MIDSPKSISMPLQYLGYGFLLFISVDFLLLFVDFIGNGDASILGIQNQKLLLYLKCIIIAIAFILFINQNLKKNIQNFLLSFASISIMLFMIEMACRVVLSAKSSEQFLKLGNISLAQKNCVQVGPDYTNVYNNDSELGIVPKPLKQFKWVKKCGKDHYIFNVSFKTDKYSRRLTPNPFKGADKYALFFGCSFTFGDGLNDNQTLPYFFQSFNKQFRSYNYGFNTYTTTHMLAHLKRTGFYREINEKNGVAFYIFYNGHIERNIPSMSWGRSWEGNYLVYQKNSIKKTGIIKDEEPIKYWAFKTAKEIAFLNLFQINYPLKLRDENLEKTADIIEDAYHIYKKKFGNKNFIVLVYPGSTLPLLIKQRLKTLNISIIDYADLFTLQQSEFWIKGDGHPNEKANQRVAEVLGVNLRSRLKIFDQ